jgi:phosphohistidine phosphatase
MKSAEKGMLRLLLLRHAKADRSQPGEPDRERVLAARGRTDAPKLGAYLQRHGLIPDLAAVSPSERTRETWARAAAELKSPPPARFDERLYEASPEAILKVIKETPPEIQTLLVVGHNPGLQELAVMLVASGAVDARQRLKEQFPTSALAVIDFAVEDWSRLHPQAGRLEHFVTPRLWEAAAD